MHTVTKQYLIIMKHSRPTCRPIGLWDQCSRIRISRFFSKFRKNAFFTFSWNDMSKKRRKRYQSFRM